ncbi:hypothetical protein HF086_001218 [Spodoptera exigua]|uniref:Uncharacterized protein n=1 Tax=Spodoptera exigua TaxID=7107 RepID=A0A922MC48_SPOEX|nr:hypothetical protein HF086_001218 [Spodoptera exigua]
MSHFFKVLMVILVFVKQEADLALTLRKFVNQKDLSEYCRRRVMPSVFLGRHVVDAYSKILQFSRLELPYSCYISVRTESGSNIILVIQLVSSRNLVESCRESKNQLLVYELGETFGGYWGALPNRVMDMSPKKDEIQYTIKTTQPATTTRTKARPNDTYKTKVLPLLQFSLENKDIGGALRSTVTVEPEIPKYQVQFNPDIFTTDYRSFPMFQYPTFVSPAHDILFTSHYSTSQFLGNAEPASESWDAVNAILKNLNRSEHVSTYQGLVPHVSIARHPVTSAWHSTMGYKTDSITWRQPSATYRTNYLDDEEEETGTTQVTSSTMDNKDGSTGFLLPILDVDNVVLNYIYDEDRLMCGRSAGLQHNVCLAAITFLAVLLTLLYIIHYWLKRCVPRVSEAFFIYTDAAENVLYLDPIMRSPYDTDDYSKDFYRSGGIQDYMECTDMRIKTTSVSPFIRRFLRLFQWRYKKNAASVKNEDVEIDLTQRIFSYGKLELNKLGVSPLTDTAVQTGSSLIEMRTLSTAIVTNKSLELNSEIEDVVTHYEGKKRSTKINVFEVDDRVSSDRISEELSILNFFKRPRSISAQLPLYREGKSSEYLTELSPQKGEEEEMQSLDFDSTIVVTGSVASINTDISEKKLEHANVQKKLRFDEEIKAVSHSDNDNVEEVHGRPRWSVMYGTEKNVHLEQLGSANRVDEPSTSTNKKGHFWGSSKSKPKKQPKKKTQLLPTLKF